MVELVITSLGMVSSLGHDVVTACAAIRAGLTRPAEVAYFPVIDVDEQEMIPLKGHPVSIAQGFVDLGAWTILSVVCLKDLIKFGALPEPFEYDFWKNTALIGVLPSFNEKRFAYEDSITPDSMKSIFLEKLAAFLDLPFDLKSVQAICIGHAGLMEALNSIRETMQNSAVERTIILGVDSYLDPVHLRSLIESDRLKVDTNPVGLMPGQAASAVLLESSQAASRRKAYVHAVVRPAAIELEINHLFSGNPNKGEGLAKAISHALEIGDACLPFKGDLISDLNGENWRAKEHGNARVRVGEKLDASVHVVAPAECLGETGSASGVIAMCIAARSFSRNYSTTEQVLITSSSENGFVGAVVLSRPPDLNTATHKKMQSSPA